MTTILIINAASSLLATVGIGGSVAWKYRQERRQVAYVTSAPQRRRAAS